MSWYRDIRKHVTDFPRQPVLRGITELMFELDPEEGVEMIMRRE